MRGEGGVAMAKTYPFCPVEQEFLSGILNPNQPCEHCVDGCGVCPHVIEVDEYGCEILDQASEGDI